MTAIDINRLIAIGGNEWRRGQSHRIYFLSPQHLSGLSCTGPGFPTFKGRKITNAQAKEVSCAIRKFWYDVPACVWNWEISDTRIATASELGKAIAEEIKRRLDKLPPVIDAQTSTPTHDTPGDVDGHQ